MTQQIAKKLLVVGVLLIASSVAVWQSPGQKTAPPKVLQQSSIQPGFLEVLQVFDGDTIEVNMNGTKEKIRLIGVDTPETQDPRKPVQCFGEAASEFTHNLIGNSRVRLEADNLSGNRDRYKRLLRYVYLPDGRLVNAEIIKQGYGFALLGFPFEKMEEFKAYETEAQQANRGLWNACQPTIDSKGIIRSNPVGR